MSCKKSEPASSPVQAWCLSWRQSPTGPNWKRIGAWSGPGQRSRGSPVLLLLVSFKQNTGIFMRPGTCWGSYMTIRMSSLPEVVAGVGLANITCKYLRSLQVSVHPSHSVLIPQLGEDEAKILGQVDFNPLSSPTQHVRVLFLSFKETSIIHGMKFMHASHVQGDECLRQKSQSLLEVGGQRAL